MSDNDSRLKAILADLRRQREDLQKLLEQGKLSRHETAELITRIRILRETADETVHPTLIGEGGETPLEDQK